MEQTIRGEAPLTAQPLPARGAFPLYRDIAERTQGDVYIGVVGPVRTGKSTFIANFMEKLVLPLLPPGPKRDRVADELPQSGSGRTIMTTQPAFVPGEAVDISPEEGTRLRVRMVDSVGYLVRGALGTQENEAARMVKTPWQEGDIPFEEAAALGTRKVIEDHATIGVVVTTDGTIADLPRSAYVEAEERVVRELTQLGKPFVVVLNSAAPEGGDAKALRDSLSEKYDVPVALMSVKSMTESDIRALLTQVLFEFPLREVRITPPAWLSALDTDHWLVSHVLEAARAGGEPLARMRDKAVFAHVFDESEYALPLANERAEPGEGRLTYQLPLREGLFNRILGEQCGAEIKGDAHLLALMKELVSAKAEYDRVAGALRAVEETGYGLVAPAMSQITLQEPEIVKQGSRFGVRLKASAPALHIIRSDIETEVSPVMGTQEQSNEFIRGLMEDFQSDPQRIWNTNFFGRSLQELVREGLSGKLSHMPVEAQEKLQQALTKMINEGTGGMICILL